MQSLYKRSWFPGIGAKPLESIRIGCEPSPAQSIFFFASYFICVREPDLVFAEAGHKQTAKSQNKTAIKKKTKTISFFFVIPESMSRYYRLSTSQYRRSTSQHGRSTSCPRVVLGSLCFQHAIFFLLKFSVQAKPRMFEHSQYVRGYTRYGRGSIGYSYRQDLSSLQGLSDCQKDSKGCFFRLFKGSWNIGGLLGLPNIWVQGFL